MTTLFFFYLGRKQRLILLFFKARPKTLQVPGCPGPHSQDDPFTAQWGAKWCMLTLTCSTHSSRSRMTSRPRPSIFRPQPPSQVFLGWGTIPSTPPVTCKHPAANASLAPHAHSLGNLVGQTLRDESSGKFNVEIRLVANPHCGRRPLCVPMCCRVSSPSHLHAILFVCQHLYRWHMCVSVLGCAHQMYVSVSILACIFQGQGP